MDEKPEEKKEEKPAKKKPVRKIKKRQNRQVMWVLLLMAAAIIIILGFPVAKHEIFDKFEFSKLNFEKTMTGDVVFYQTSVPVVDKEGQISSFYGMQFRNDPRELDNIPVDEKIEKGGLLFLKNNIVYVAIDPEMRACEDNSLALLTLGSFLKDFQLTTKSAFTDKDYANATGFPYKTCSDSQSNTIINVVSGNETKIYKETKNCYVIEFDDCDIQKGIERFILEVIKGYMKNFEKV